MSDKPSKQAVEGAVKISSAFASDESAVSIYDYTVKTIHSACLSYHAEKSADLKTDLGTALELANERGAKLRDALEKSAEKHARTLPDPGEGWRIIDKEKDGPKQKRDEFWSISTNDWDIVPNEHGGFYPDDIYRRRISIHAPVAKEEKCERCGGKKTVEKSYDSSKGEIDCPTCNGTGNRPREQYNSHCPSCHAYNSGENTKCQQCGILRMTWTEHLNKQREEVKMKDRCLCAYEYHQDRGTVRHRHANCPVHQAALATEQSESPAVGARECWGVPGKFGMRNYYPSKDVAEQYQDGIRPIVRFIEHTAYQAKVEECERLRAALQEIKDLDHSYNRDNGSYAIASEALKGVKA